MNDYANRVPAGVPTGGQFAGVAKSETDVSLEAHPMSAAEFGTWSEFSTQLRMIDNPHDLVTLPDGSAVHVVPADSADDEKAGIVEAGQYNIERPGGGFGIHAFTNLTDRARIADEIARASVVAARDAHAPDQRRYVDDPGGFWDGAEIIGVYTREQALADGALKDYSAMAREAGFKYPFAMTADAHAEAVSWTRDDGLQDEDGRAWDVVWMAAQAAKRQPGPGEDPQRREFTVLRVPNNGRGQQPRPTTLVLHIGPGDTPEPVMTVMVPGED